MTTAAEVKRWTKDILAEHEDLRLEGRDLFLVPVQHILRSIDFLGSSDKTFPKPTASFGILCGPPSAPFGHGLGLDLHVGYSTDPGFHNALAQQVRGVLSGPLRRLSSIQMLYDLTLEHGLIWASPNTRLSSHPVSHAVVLVALGKLPEASKVIADRIDLLDETGLRARLAAAERLLSSRPRSSTARSDIDMASYWLRQISDLEHLGSLVRVGDRSGIGALLRSWERDRVRALGIEHLWEATSFPVEESA